jgi:hypothetical protein
MRDELARVTLRVKLAALTLRLLENRTTTTQPTDACKRRNGILEIAGWDVLIAHRFRIPHAGCGRQSHAVRSPGFQSAEVLA